MKDLFAFNKKPHREPVESDDGQIQSNKRKLPYDDSPPKPTLKVNALIPSRRAEPLSEEGLKAVQSQIVGQLVPRLVSRLIGSKRRIDFDNEGLFAKRLPNTTADLVNKRVGKLLVIAIDSHDKQGHALWRCKCDCGNIKMIRTQHLTSHHTISCGCHRDSKDAGFNKLWISVTGGMEIKPRIIDK